MKKILAAVPLALCLLQPAWASGPDIEALCLEHSNMGADLCTCVAAKATELTEDQQAFIAATLAGDDAETAHLRGTMPVKDLMDAGMFLPNAPIDCAAGN